MTDDSRGLAEDEPPGATTGDTIDDDEPELEEPDDDENPPAGESESGDPPAECDYVCWDGLCVSATDLCDGYVDCEGGEDELDCYEPDDPCLEDEYLCEDGVSCIAGTWVCDGEEDCPTGDDERDCGTSSCEPGQYVCDEGTCLGESDICDGWADCDDGTDEAGCGGEVVEEGCVPPMVQCLIGDHCIAPQWQCDGEIDCPFGLDELVCLPPAATYFECLDGTLIPIEYLCDGYFVDCSGGEDEYACA